ncbi:uncharacterized protein LOC106875796 [Octopus bimaculoides]|uniref:Uncharacterized protein n=1 Tax=Octopus bimaculoides TaxID=37653 RepID=A0A0L8GNE0_OCTBM|nr:uncharacterized protein LOC106875796 [Octopus bimaculoides]|eukprot:XP_014779551.1 PREDICTED: uncharacterized protein LOC106875796 [Octopus bimaculoides]
METTDPPSTQETTLTSIILAFLCFIAAISLCHADSCYSCAQYKCQKEMSGVVEAKQNPGENYKYSCGNFTKLSKCIIHHLDLCVQKGEKNDSQTFIDDVVKHHTEDPYNCPKVDFGGARKGDGNSALTAPWTIPIVSAIYLTKYLYNYI